MLKVNEKNTRLIRYIGEVHSELWGRLFGHNPGKIIVDKFTKLNQGGFSMECVEAKFLQFSFCL